MLELLAGHDLLALILGAAAGLACGFLNTMASSGSAVSLPILMVIGLDPVTGAALAEVLPGRYLALIITAAVLVAFVLLFTKLKQTIDRAETHPVRLGRREALMFFGIGIWLGFIVLDGATYMLLALVLVVGLALVRANALKSAVLIPTAVVAMGVFAAKGNVDWTLVVVMALGSVLTAWGA